MMRLAEAERLWLEYRRKDIRKEKDAGKRLRILRTLATWNRCCSSYPKACTRSARAAHPRLGADSPVRLLPRPLLRVIARFAHEKIDVNAADEQRGLDPGGTALHRKRVIKATSR